VIFFLGCFAFGLTGASIGFLSLGGLLFGGALFGQFIIDNQNMLASVPAFGAISAGGFGIGLLLLACIIIISLFKGKMMASVWFLGTIALLGVCFFSGVAAVSSILGSYTNVSTDTDAHMLSIPAEVGDVKLLGLETFMGENMSYFRHSGVVTVELKKATGT